MTNHKTDDYKLSAVQYYLNNNNQDGYQNTSKKCCGCLQNLTYYKNKENKDVFRLLVCSTCVSYENKQTVFRTRDVNSAANIRSITKTWIETQKRNPAFQISSFTTSNKKEVEKVRPS